MMYCMPFEEAQLKMQPGDVIAFGGSSHFSGIIKMAIRAEVSHIGIILYTEDHADNPGACTQFIIDSTSRQGVAISRLQDRFDQYDGDVWWLPLRHELRQERFRYEAFHTFLRSQQGKTYDHAQAAGSAIDFFDNVQLPFGLRGPGYNTEDFEEFFCSELVAAGLKAGGVLPADLNASEVTPIDICCWQIFAPDYYLMKGKPIKEISGYNSLQLSGNHYANPA